MIAARPHRPRMITRARPEPGAGSRRGDVIPYDYGAAFPITGQPGNVVQSVINTAPDSLFVAVAIGYGFEEDRGRPLSFLRAAGNGTVVPGNITLGELGELATSALIEGFRVNPRSEHLVFREDARRGREFADDPLPDAVLNNGTLFQRVRAPAEISFLFSIVDSGTGRELQDEPVHNIASLGKSNGERPFRLLAQPITFLPRTTLRLQIIERSQGVQGNLFVVFYGYQIVGSSGCPELLTRQLTGTPTCPTETIGSPSARVIPFDYVTTFQLTGRPGNQLESETTVNAEGGFVASSIGYALLVEERAVPLRAIGGISGSLDDSELQTETLSIRNIRTNSSRDFRPGPDALSPCPFSFSLLEPGEYEISYRDVPLTPPVRVEPGKASQVKVTSESGSTTIELLAPLPLDVDLEQLPLGMLPPDALLDGLRIKPQLVRLAFENNGDLSHELPLVVVNQLFERLNRPEDVSFRYTIFDSGRGRELQNQPLHNIAGLGIADGDRPFKKLARSMIFQPRSTIRIRVEERFGRGTLFIVLQGYKFLSAPAGAGLRR